MDANLESRSPESQRPLHHPLLCRACYTLGHSPSVQDRVALVPWYHTPGATMIRFWAGTILLWAASIWHLSIGTISRIKTIRVTFTIEEQKVTN